LGQPEMTSSYRESGVTCIYGVTEISIYKYSMLFCCVGKLEEEFVF